MFGFDSRSWAESRRTLLGAGLFVATIAVYASVGGHSFLHYDDYLMVVDNPNLTREVTPLSLLRHFWTPYWGNWLPIYWISLHLDYGIHGANAGAFLLTNVWIHAAAAAALFAALARMTGALGCSLFVAAVFALHPLHVESVAWITERKDVLAGLFWMLGMYAYAAYVETPGSRVKYAMVVVCLTLGLLSKALCVTFPFVLLLLDYWPLARLDGAWRARVLEKLPLLAIVLLVSGITYWTQQEAGNMGLSESIGLTGRVLNAVQSYWFYLLDAVWPSGLAAVYPHPFALRSVATQDWLWTSGIGLTLTGATGLILMAARMHPYLPVGWFWYLGTLVPMIGIVHVGSMARADRYMYVPLIGLAIIAAWGARSLAGPALARPLVAVGTIVVAALSVATGFQIRHWQSSTALFERAIAVTERNRFAHENLALVLAEQSRNEAAARHFEEALRIEPRRTRSIFGLAVMNVRLERTEAAIERYQEGLALNPKKVRAHGSLGKLLVDAGRFDEAEEHLAFAIRYLPDDTEVQAAIEAMRVATGRQVGATLPEPSQSR